MVSTRVEHNALEGYRARRTPAVREVQDRTGDHVFATEQVLVPVLTGNLKSTIKKEREGDTITISVGGEQAGYAGYVNSGTEKQAAQPFHDEAAQEGRRYQNEEYAKL